MGHRARMRTRLRGVVFVGLSGLTAAALLDGCGSRTGLPADELFPDVAQDAAPDAPKKDTGRDVSVDADAREEDALPSIDSRPRPDVRRDDCPDADATLVYVVASDNSLFSFYPPTLQFTRIGRIDCNAGVETPFSMAVDRKGKAYVVFTDGRLYQVSTATAACVGTPFVPGQQAFRTFGMGFVSNNGGSAETLFVAQSPDPNTNSRGLASIDTTSPTLPLSFIGPFTPPIERVELTGTGEGRLFGYAPLTSGSRIVEIDKTNGDVLASDTVATGTSQDAFAFAFWGGDFWVFTGAASTEVVRYRPADKSTTVMSIAPALIVGAGVSTCAPQ